MTATVDRLVAEGYAVQRVNVDRQPELAAKYGVQSIPCFVWVEGGREVHREVGVVSASSGSAGGSPKSASPKAPNRPDPASRLALRAGGGTPRGGGPHLLRGGGPRPLDRQRDAGAVERPGGGADGPARRPGRRENHRRALHPEDPCGESAEDRSDLGLRRSGIDGAPGRSARGRDRAWPQRHPRGRRQARIVRLRAGRPAGGQQRPVPRLPAIGRGAATARTTGW